MVLRSPLLVVVVAMTPTTPAQKALWGRQQNLPGTRQANGHSTNDMDLVGAVLRSAQEPGYVVIGPAERVFLRDPAGVKDAVTTVPKYESDTVSQLLTAGHLTLGGTHHVVYSGNTGPALSVLVPKATRRWPRAGPH